MWVGADHPYADIIRRLEHAYFPAEIPSMVTPQMELASLFMLLVVVFVVQVI